MLVVMFCEINMIFHSSKYFFKIQSHTINVSSCACGLYARVYVCVCACVCVCA